MKTILLNPGPANTHLSVKLAQVCEDICPREEEFGDLIANVCQKLCALVEEKTSDKADLACVLFGGSGTAAVEATLGSVVGQEDRLLIINNGAYGARMAEIARYAKICFEEFLSDGFSCVDFKQLEEAIITYKPHFLAYVHSETTTGLLNDATKISQICKKYGVKIIADCMSSLGAYPIKHAEMDYIIASSNKNIQAIAGLGFVIASKADILEAKHSRSLYLDLCEQFLYFSKHKQMRFTPPVQCAYALDKALDLLLVEGVANRMQRYQTSHTTLRLGLEKLGLKPYPTSNNGHIITSVELAGMDFKTLHDFCKDYGFVIYPGKVAGKEMFRIANIGDITHKDIELFLFVLEKFITNTKG
ncbi:aminotransferase class V-fold PLP-dependent enzyme [Helicobacter sp. 11S02596-1]|uniref:aminotransferase class V-fold PLP-dependent enzyme n=1 Tax=Helicobacter sp. 11S02596-1 TaxID=1476194 RepID=UPI000BA73164|nr:aminotransferase class V-fold PLP-dependent enzyme [Helicobacter sp. 11S02596-1]PAF41425.1 aminotransferase [Helicobacter sp. 11S02596-1]